MLLESDDQQLLKAIAGDRAALSALLARHTPQVRIGLAGAIGSRWRSVLDIDDVMQITFIEAFLNIREFKQLEPSSFGAWLRRIAEHNLQDAIKGLSAEKRPDPRRRVHSIGQESSVALLDLLSGSGSTPSGKMGRNESISRLHSAIRGLPEDYRIVIERYDLNGEPIEEVAQAMGRTNGAVYMLRARAHDHLREILGTSSQF